MSRDEAKRQEWLEERVAVLESQVRTLGSMVEVLQKSRQSSYIYWTYPYAAVPQYTPNLPYTPPTYIITTSGSKDGTT